MLARALYEPLKVYSVDKSSLDVELRYFHSCPHYNHFVSSCRRYHAFNLADDNDRATTRVVDVLTGDDVAVLDFALLALSHGATYGLVQDAKGEVFEVAVGTLVSHLALSTQYLPRR